MTRQVKTSDGKMHDKCTKLFQNIDNNIHCIAWFGGEILRKFGFSEA